MDQLDILKEEMAALKRNLDKEQIINDKLMRKVMKQQASWLNTFVKAEFISIPFIWLIFAAFSAYANISIWYANAFVIIGVLDALFDLRTMRIPPKIFSTYTMLEMRQFLIRQKKERLIHVCVATPLAVIWVLLFGNAAFHRSSDDPAVYGGIIGGIVGLCIAIPIIIILYRKAQKTNDTLLDDISE